MLETLLRSSLVDTAEIYSASGTTCAAIQDPATGLNKKTWGVY
jgi:hypothetical protein